MRGNNMDILSRGMYLFVLDTLKYAEQNYFEIGVFNGEGFAHVAKNFPNKTCYALDPFIEDGHTKAYSQVETGSRMQTQRDNYFRHTSNLSNTVLFETTSKEYLDRLTDQDAADLNVSTVVIDGDHHYENVVIDFNLAIKLIGNKEGVIIVDDTDVADVGRAYNEFVNLFKDRITLDETCGGSTRVLMLKNNDV